jgi:hypothetical protein
VSWNKKCGKWEVRIRVKTKKLHLGLFRDKIECARVYDEYAKKYHKDFANLNNM